MQNNWEEIRPRIPIGVKITEEEFKILKSYLGHTPTLGELQEIARQAWEQKIASLKNKKPAD